VLSLLCTAASGCTDAPHPSDESPCESCRIELETVWESREQDPDVEMGLTLFRIGDHFWGSGGMFGHRIVGLSASHDSSIVIDRPGDGPGEFESDITWAVRIPGDSIVFFSSRTASVFDSRMRYVREFAVPGPVYASGAFFDPVEDEIIGYTPGAIFRLSRDGSLAAVDSSATLQGRFRPIAPVPGHRHLFQVLNHDSGFRVVRRSYDGDVLGTRDFTPAWWQTPSEESSSASEHGRAGPPRPQSQVNQLFVWDGVLWAIGVSADTNWSDADPADDSSFLDTFLLALDWNSGMAQSTHVFDDIIVGRQADGRFLAYRTTGAGHPRISLLDLEFRGESAALRHLQ